MHLGDGMSDPFETSRRKIGRAKEHIADLEREAEVFWQTNERSIIVEPDPVYSDEEIHNLKFAQSLPARFSDLTADAVQNLRSSLDDAVYGVAVAAGKLRPKYATFPFGRDAVAFEGFMKARCKDIPRDLYPLFRAYQPYRGGDYALWELNQISITDKHKLLRIRLLGHLPGGVPMIIEAPWDRLKNQFKFEGYVAGIGSEFYEKKGLTPFIAFDDIPDALPALPKTVPEILAIFLNSVEYFLRDLRTVSRRLGYIP
jgi:hypothetical protein